MATEFINGQWRIPNSWNVDESNQKKISNYSMDFNGVDGNINLGAGSPFNFNNAAGDLPFSFSMWFNIRDYGNIPNASGLFAKNAEVSLQQYRVLYFSSKLRLMIATQGTGSGESFIEQTNTWVPNANQWYHLVFTYDGRGGNDSASGLKMYIDKVEQTVSVTQGSYDKMITTAAPLVIGSRSDDSNYTKGSFDLFSVFDYELTQAQINTLYGDSAAGYFQVGNPMALTTNPVAFYQLGDQDLIGVGNYNGANWLVPNQVTGNGFNSVFNFNGSQLINLNNGSSSDGILGETTSFTVSAWIKPTAGTHALLGSFGGGTTTKTFGITILASSLLIASVGTFTGGSFSQYDSRTLVGSSITFGVWQHISVIYDATDLKIFINGVNLTHTTSVPANITLARTVSSYPDVIGRFSQFNNPYYTGQLSNLSIWRNVVQNPVTLYNNGVPSDLTSLNPTSWYKLNNTDVFNSGTGNWTIKDYGSRGEDGTSDGMTSSSLVNSDLPSSTSGYSPYAIDLDGVDQNFVVDNSSEDLNTDFISISAWFFQDNTAANSSFPAIIINGFTGSGNSYWGLVMRPGNIVRAQLKLTDSNGNEAFVIQDITETITTGQWNHVAMTYDGTTLKGYINGVEETLSLVTSAPGVTPIVTSSGPILYSVPGMNSQDLLIGKRGTDSFRINGKLSNISIFSSGLSRAQVATIYNNGIPGDISSLNPLAWWELGSMMGFNGGNTYTALSNTDSNYAAVSTSTMEDVSVVNGPGYSNGGLGTSSLVIEKQAPYSFNNALSQSMAISNRDDSQASDTYPFIFELDLSAQSNPFTWNSANMNSSVNTFPFTVDWGDGTVESIALSDLVNLKLQHVYDTSAYPRPVIQYGRADDVGRLRSPGAAGTQPPSSLGVIRSLKQIGRAPWSQLRIYDWTNAISQTQSSDIPDLSNLTNLASCFYKAQKMNQANVGQWDMSNIRTATAMFYQNLRFNQDLNTWDTSSLRSDNIAGMDLRSMFSTCNSFNGNIANFFMGRTTSGSSMFYQNFAMNQDLSTKFISAAASPTGSSYVAWDVSNFTNYQSMLGQCKVFNKSISNWNIGGNSSITSINFSNLFAGSFRFDQDISTKFISAAASPTNVAYTAWDTSKVTNMSLMLYNAQDFGTIGDISNWNTSNVTTLSNFSNYSDYFNNDLSTKSVIVNGVTYTAWDVSSCLNFASMFYDADAFSKNLRSWNLNPNITNVVKMFFGANNAAVGMSVANYTDTIVGWAIKHTQGTYNPNNLDFNTVTASQPGFETSRIENEDNDGTKTNYSVLYGAAWTNTGWTEAGDAADYLKRSTGEGGAGWQDFESKRV